MGNPQEVAAEYLSLKYLLTSKPFAMLLKLFKKKQYLRFHLVEFSGCDSVCLSFEHFPIFCSISEKIYHFGHNVPKKANREEFYYVACMISAKYSA